MNPEENIPYYPALAIAQSLADAGTVVSKKTIQRRAEAEGWPVRQVGNKLEYQPPQDVLARMQARPESTGPAESLMVRFADLTGADDQRQKVLLREQAVLFYQEHVKSGLPIEFSLSAATLHYSRRAMEEGLQLTTASRTVRRWVQDYAAHGLDGLVEQKRGIVGSKSIASQVDEETLLKIKAHGIEAGSGGRTNLARGFREVLAQPNTPEILRSLGTETYTSKSHVPKSIRAAATASPLTTCLAHMGPRQARLSSRWTPGDYSDVRANDVWCADDMTSNVLCWVEWPNAQGYRVVQAQVLAVIDVGSMRWLGCRVVIRESGQYTSDDIWGTFGDMFDQFGLPKVGFVLEGGHWQSHKVRGQRTGLTSEERVGGLSSLGLKVWHARSPGAKIIETAFNQLQRVLDSCPGYIGREQRVDKNEAVAKAQRLAERVHPKGLGILHQRELADRIEQAMASLNHERNDGMICRGAAPLDKWQQDSPEKREVPEAYRWLYRSAMNVVKVTRNGIRVTQGSGKNLLAYYYDAEWVTAHEGRTVRLHWNHANPEADAVVMTNEARPEFLGMARYVQPVARFTGSETALEEAARRKQAALHYSRSELRSVQPELQRPMTRQPVVAADASANRIGNALAEANERQATQQRQQARTTRHVQRVELSEADRLAANPEATQPGGEPSLADEFSELFSEGQRPETPAELPDF